ncbi:MAG: RNA polymerase subunit sigma-24 [Planctomycetes bacterium]|nr:RNA polymerase subunit sigma-24 [Planctomycetota bacterium]
MKSKASSSDSGFNQRQSLSNPAEMIRNLSETMYANMRAISGRYMQSERADHTLSATALVNEAVATMLGPDKPTNFNNRNHVLAAAALAMRRVLVDHARARLTSKRGGSRRNRWTDVGQAISRGEDPSLLLEINEALEQLKIEDVRQSAIAEYLLFGGLKQSEIADLLGVSLATVEKDWREAKEFLATKLSIDSDQN